MKILVTGCAGFIGSHLCEKLVDDGNEVVGIDNFDDFYSKDIKMKNLEKLNQLPGFVLRNVDISVKNDIEAIKDEFELVIHLAAKAGVRPSIEKPRSYIDTNIVGTQNILDLMLNRKVSKIIFASSSSIYGDSTVAPYSEDAIVDFPISPYAFTKKSCELMLYTYHHLYHINSVSLRFFTVYGPRQRPDLAINKFFTAIEKDEPIYVFGDGSTLRDYTFIGDIVKGIISSIRLINAGDKTYEIVNLGNNRPIELLTLIQKIEETIGKKAKLIYKEMQPGDVIMTCADTSKAGRLLNYQPETPIEKGLALYYQWRQSQRKQSAT